MRPYLTRILLLLLLVLPFVAARTNFTQCLIDFRNETDAVGGVDYRGRPTNSADAVGFTYETCTARCGSDSEAFNWREFTQLFASWLLPWLALISQLPFGSGNYADDFVSVIISVGSPALAAYSLVLTSLTGRAVFRRAKRCLHDNKEDVANVANALLSLQQTSLELTKDTRLLAYIPINHHWRQEIAERLDRRNAWSVAAATSVAWVVVAYLFTLIDSFVSLASDLGDEPSEGQAVGTLWLWLLCLVVGWLWVPTFTSGELRRAIDHSNRQAVKKAAKRIKQRANKAIHSAKKVTARFTRRAPVIREPREPGTPEEDEKFKEEPVQGGTDPKVDPSADPVQQQPTITYQADPEAQQDHGHLTTSGNPTANHSVVTLPRSIAHHSIAQSSIHPEKDSLFVHVDHDSLTRDELRVTATFNYSRVMRYLCLVDDVLRALEQLARNREEEKRRLSEGPTSMMPVVKDRTFPRGALTLMFNAAVVSLVLQCGITAAATGIVIFTPTIGLGCRSLGYVVYGGLSIVIMVLTMISTIFTRVAETRRGKSPFVAGFTGFIAVALRRICLLLATMNMIGLLLISCLQFSNFLDNCYCNASVLGQGTGSYIIVTYNGWFDTMRTARIVATVLAGASMFIYMVFLWLMSALPSDPQDM